MRDNSEIEQIKTTIVSIERRIYENSMDNTQYHTTDSYKEDNKELSYWRNRLRELVRISIFGLLVLLRYTV